MTIDQLRLDAFKLLATAIPRIGTRFGDPEATAAVLDGVYQAAIRQLTTRAVHDVAPHRAAQEATQRLARLPAQKGGTLPEVQTTPADGTSISADVACYGYEAVWDTIAAVTSRQPLPPLAKAIFAAQAEQPDS